MKPKDLTPEEQAITSKALLDTTKAVWGAIAEVGEALDREHEGMAVPVVVSSLLMIAADLLHEAGRPVQVGENILRQAYARAVTGELFGEDDEDESNQVHFINGTTTLQ